MSPKFNALKQAIEDLIGTTTASKHTETLKKAFDSYCEETKPKRRKVYPKRVFIEIDKGIPTIYATKGVEIHLHDTDIYEDGDMKELCERKHPFLSTLEGIGKPDYYVSRQEITTLRKEAQDRLKTEQEACD